MEDSIGKCNSIRHSGVVVALLEGRVTVSIVSKSSCASCHVKSACSASDTKDKIVEADVKDGFSVVVGDEVDVVISQNNGYLAVLLSYLVPVVIIFMAIIVLTNLGYSELMAALCGLAFMVVYFTVLYLFRKKIDKKLVVEVVSKLSR